MDRRDVLLRLTERLIAAPGSVEGWQAFLLDLCDVLKGSAASFISHDLATNTASIAVNVRSDPEDIVVYNQQWHQFDPWAHSPKLDRRSGAVILGEELIAHEAMKRTAFYNDFGRHCDVVRCVAGIIEAEPHILSAFTINGSEERGAFDQQDRELIVALTGPFKRALELHRRLRGAELLAASAASALDRLPHGVLLLSSRGGVQFLNGAAEQILAARDGLWLEKGELRASNAAGTMRLRSALHNAARIFEGELIHAETALALERPSGKRPLAVLAAPLPRRGPAFGIDQAAVAVFVTDTDRPAPTQAETLRAMFGLTRAEAQLLLTLLEGLSVKEAAARLELATETVRKRLKVIFQKTDTHRQSELMRHVLLSTLPRIV